MSSMTATTREYCLAGTWRQRRRSEGKNRNRCPSTNAGVDAINFPFGALTRAVSDVRLKAPSSFI